MAQSKLDAGMTEAIAGLRRLNLSWNQIAGLLGVATSTIRSWKAQAKTAKSGKYREFADVIARAEAGMVKDCSKVVFDAIRQGSETVTERELTNEHGQTRTETVTKREGPDASLALKVLERLDPARWGRIITMKANINWENAITEQGGNPTKAAAVVAGALQELGGVGEEEADDV